MAAAIPATATPTGHQMTTATPAPTVAALSVTTDRASEVSPFVAAVRRGLVRAKSESIVVYRTADANVLGVATIKKGVWAEKAYILTIHGPRYRQTTCNCLAGQSGTLCKHVAVGMLARKHGVYAIRPQEAPAHITSPTRMAIASPLDALFG